jgi:hypothetical protein
MKGEKKNAAPTVFISFHHGRPRTQVYWKFWCKKDNAKLNENVSIANRMRASGVADWRVHWESKSQNLVGQYVSCFMNCIEVRDNEAWISTFPCRLLSF